VALRDDRYDPPRISPWWVVYLVVGVLLCVAIVVAAALDGRWFTAVAFAVIAISVIRQVVEVRRRHHAALAGWRPLPLGPRRPRRTSG
jgi:hypothetical protein